MSETGGPDGRRPWDGEAAEGLTVTVDPTTRAILERRSAKGDAGVALRREAEVLARARHPGIPDLRSVSESDDEVTVVLERPAGVALGLSTLSPEEVAGVVAVLATTVADLHDIGIAHGRVGDAAVVLAEDGRPTLVDFSDARFLDGPRDRWSAHPATRADDRQLGDLIRFLLGTCAPTPVGRALDGRQGGRPRGRLRWATDLRRGSDPGPAGTLDRCADAAVGGRMTAREVAGEVIRRAPGAHLPIGAVPLDVDARPGEVAQRSDVPHRRTDPARRSATHAPGPGGPDADQPAQASGAPARSASRARRGHHRVALLGASALGAGLLLLGHHHVRRPAIGAHTPGADRDAVARLPPSWTSPRDATLPGRGSSPGAPRPAPEPGAPHLCVPSAGPRLPSSCGSLVVDRGEVTIGSARFAVGRPGDPVLAGRWLCQSHPTLAVLRPRVGSLWTFQGWPTGTAPIGAVLVAQIPGALTLGSKALGSCDALVVGVADGSSAEVHPWEVVKAP